MTNNGRLLLIPAALSDSKPTQFLAPQTIELVYSTRHFIAERGKTARHYLKSIGYPLPMAEVSMSEISKHGEDDVKALLEPCLNGFDCGLLSEAGVPAVADPGGAIVRVAHELGIEVLPLIGPSSILLALMASGFNGQRFSFHGYLAKDENELGKQIRQLEVESLSQNITQIFIETPYRNQKMIHALIRHLRPTTEFCLAVNLTASDQKIITLSIENWKKVKNNFDRKPAVFLIYAGKNRS